MSSIPENPKFPAEVQPSLASELAVAAPVEPAPAEALYPPWNGWDILRILLMLVVTFFIAGVALLILAPGPLRERANYLSVHPEFPLIGQLAAELALLGYMYILVTRERRQPRFWEAVRWNWPARIWTYLFVGVLMQAVFLFAEHFLPFPRKTPFEALLQRPASFFLIMGFSVTLGPLMEELFYRGFLYPLLKRHFGVAVGIVATALPFGLMHAAQYGNSWASVLLIFVVGLVLATVREWKNSLAASFLVHVAYNGTIVTMVFIATGGFRHLERLNQ